MSSGTTRVVAPEVDVTGALVDELLEPLSVVELRGRPQLHAPVTLECRSMPQMSSVKLPVGEERRDGAFHNCNMFTGGGGREGREGGCGIILFFRDHDPEGSG